MPRWTIDAMDVDDVLVCDTENASLEHEVGSQSSTEGDLTTTPGPCEKTARDLERDHLRAARGYHDKIAGTTDTLVRKPIRKGTTCHYQDLLREWDLFAAEYDGPRDPTNVKTAKDFILYFVSGRRGRNEPGGRLTRSYTHSSWRSFMAAWGRKYHVSFNKSLQDTILNFINGAEHAHGPDLTHKARPKRNLIRDDFVICVQQLWQNDWHDFDHERYRVGMHLALLFHCNTSARRAEYEKELRYSNITLAMVWLDTASQPQLTIDFRRSKAKGLQELPEEQPEHMLYELVGLPFYCNAIALFMAAALADGVLRDYHSWDEVCAIQRPPVPQKQVIIEFAEDKRDWFLFPRSSRGGGLDHGRPSGSLTSSALVDLGFRAGFRDNLVMHAARREVLLQVDNYGYSCNERMRFAAHRNPATYPRSYQTSMSMVDGQATYFQCPTNNSELHALRRSYQWRRNLHHQPKLQETTRVALENGVEDDGDLFSRPCLADEPERQKLYDQKRQQRDTLLRLQHAESPPQLGQPHESDFAQTRKIMPERDRLARSLFHEGSLRDKVGCSVMGDLIELCRDRSRPTYCDGLNTSGSKCDVCRKTCRRGEEHSWWSHLYQCRKTSVRHAKGFAEFCFLCFTWHDEATAWHDHAQEHLQNLPLKCNMTIFRRNVVRPALCPVCLRDGDFRQFINLTTWKNHLHSHVLNKRLTRCPHPRCEPTCKSMTKEELLDHLADAHEIRFQTKQRTRSLRRDAGQDGVQKLSFVSVDPAPVASSIKVTPASSESDDLNIADEREAIGDSVAEDEADLVGLCNPIPTLANRMDHCPRPGDELVVANNIPGVDVQCPPSRLCHSDNSTGTVHGIAPIQEPITKRLRLISVNVPPVPDWGYSDDMPGTNTLLGNQTGHFAVKASDKAMVVSRRGRGRPRGSRNRKTLRRDQRRALALGA